MVPVSSQLLPSNCKVLLLADVDGDGLLKLVTGHADRVVHIHNLVEEPGAKGQPNTGNDVLRQAGRGLPFNYLMINCMHLKSTAVNPAHPRGVRSC